MKAPARALSTVLAANAALLLGCTALQNLQGTNTNQPASPTATGTPIGAGFAKSLEGVDKALGGARENVGARIKARREAAVKAIDDITPAQERAVGQAAAINIIQNNGGLILEQNLVRYVNDVANWVGSKGERKVKRADGTPRSKARRFFVGVLNDSENANAYALPGGYILITKGLLERLSSESELAWVLGHEIAHVDHEHGLKALKLAVGAEGFFDDGSSEESKFDDPKFFTRVADKLATLTYKAGLERETEIVADELGQEYAIKSGYDSRGAKRVLETLSASLGSTETKGPRFRLPSSHDTPAKRMEILNNTRNGFDSAINGKMGIDRFDRNAIQWLEAATRGSG